MISTYVILILNKLGLRIFFPGYQDIAEGYLSKFSWGPTFIEINREILDTYADCSDAEDVIAKQNAYIQQLKEVCIVPRKSAL